MARPATYVPGSDEEQDSVRGRQPSGTAIANTKGASQKRRRSKSPAAKQTKRKKPTPSSEEGSSKSKSITKKLPIAALSVEERSAKNSTSRLTTMEKRQAAPARKELAATIERIKESSSQAYCLFELPKLIKPRAKGGPVRYHGFVCKTCRELIKRKVGSSETSSLLKHQTRCELRKHQGLLSEYGITGGGGPPSAHDVRQYVGQWIAEDGRPFAIVYDRYLRKLFPIEIIKMLPARSTIVKDISVMYRMTQNVIRKMLADVDGVFHIALDMYQSANGNDFLGLVIFHPEVKENTMGIARFVLECLSFSGKHTGLALANTVYGILRKFDIQDRVWTVVCDNASNNGDMMKRFGQFNMKRLIGPEARIHCLPHILNLASKAIALPFLKKRAELEDLPRATQGGDDESIAGGEDEDIPYDEEEGHQGEDETGDNADGDDDETGEDDGSAPSRALDPAMEDEELSDIDIPEFIAGSIASLSHKLRFSPQFKQAFQAVCELMDVQTPHNIQRNVTTRWNSTKVMIEDALRLEDAILRFQKKSDFPSDLRLTPKEFKAMKHLLKLLKPLSDLTEIMSRSNIPMLADVLVHFDSLNREYCTIALDDSLPLWARQAANRAREKLDKYYKITDTLHMYRLAILLHPSNREAYLVRLGWPQEWIDDACKIAVETWETHYKPADFDNGGDDTSSQSQFGYSTFADEVYGSFAEENDKPIDPVTNFFTGKPIIERTKSGRSKPVNPLNWWYAQRLAGEEHDGLTQLALDVLTAPASSVEVERAFSFVSHMVSKHRHRMSPYTVQTTATLGAYSRADLVPSGILAKAYQKARERTQADARAKAAKAKAKAAEAEAEALAAEHSEDELMDVDAGEDDEDVLQPSSDVEDVDLEDDD